MGFEPEYADFMCQGDDLEPGEVRVFDFDQWTPAFLEEEESGQKDYIAQATIDVEVDSDPGNDIAVNTFSLDYWHDSALEKVTSPVTGGYGGGDLLWDNGDTDGTNGYSILGSPKRTLLDDFETTSTWEISEFRTYCVAGPATDWEIAIWSDDDGDPGELILGPSVDVEYTTENTGRTWFGYAEWEVFYEFEPITIEAGRYWVEMWSGSGAPNASCMIHLGIWGSELWINYDDLGFMPGSQQFGVQADMNFRLYGAAGCCPGISIYIQPGTEAISAVAKNYGTFPELDLTCYAEIWDYITDPDNGTLQYEDMVVDIDLDTPLGGTVDLAFDDFTFEYEGRYNLFLEMLAPNDDKPNNNKIRWKIGVDATDPVSSHILDPPEPDGENGWYVNDLEVTLDASDPLSNDVSSGVKEIKYKIGGGSVQTITGGQGTFLVTQADDDEDVLVEYWAIDNVGNAESSHTFTVDMDQTDPTIDLTYEITDGNPIVGWTVLCTAWGTDETSGMDRVEFFLNYVLQETITGPGPTYQWDFIYHGGLNIAVRADGYDKAGNIAYDIIDPVISVYNQNTQQQSQSDTNSYDINKLLYKLNVLQRK